MTVIFAKPLFLILLCSTAYAVATIGMKHASDTPAIPILIAIALCLAAAVVAEVLLMRQLHLAVVYLAILATESILVLCGAWALGETLGLRQLAGAALVLGGTALVSV